MKVGVFVVMVGRQAGGPETYEHCLVRQLVSIDKNNEYHIYCLSNEAAQTFGSCGDNAKIHVLRPGCRWLSIPFSLPAQLASHRIDLLHATFTPPPWSPVDYVFTMHSSVTFTHPEFYKPSILWRLNKLIMRGLNQARVILCVSEHVRDEIAERFKLPAERLAVAYHGVNEAFRVIAPDEVKHTLAEKHNIRFPYVLYVGKLQRNKNMVRLIEAFARARKSLEPDTKLVLVGRRDWSCDGMDDAISRLELRDHVVEIGHLSHQDLPAVYSGAQMFLFPSLWEGFGIPVIEAMACGTPVITSSLACLPEVAGGAALLVDPYSIDDIAGAIHKLGTDRTMSLSLRDKGLERAKLFSWERTAQQTLEAYRRAGIDARVNRMSALKIAILSPHLDDAALSCADHALHWLKRGDSVTVVTVFTAFPENCVCDFVRPFMQRAGFQSSQAYGRQRKDEDRRAMELLGVTYHHLDFPDAGFRGQSGQADYNSYRELCPGHLADREQSWIETISETLKKLGEFNRVLVPLGVGGHVDHLIVRQAALRAFPRRIVRSYAEFPYARNPMKWTRSQMRGLLSASVSVKWISRRKRAVLGCYRSQIGDLFSGRPFYPEIVLSPG